MPGKAFVFGIDTGELLRPIAAGVIGVSVALMLLAAFYFVRWVVNR